MPPRRFRSTEPNISRNFRLPESLALKLTKEADRKHQSIIYTLLEILAAHFREARS